MINETEIYDTKETIDDIIKHDFSLCCEDDKYFFVKIITDDMYNNCVYVIDKSSRKIYWMYFTDFICIEVDARQINKKQILDYFKV